MVYKHNRSNKNSKHNHNDLHEETWAEVFLTFFVLVLGCLGILAMFAVL